MKIMTRLITAGWILIDGTQHVGDYLGNAGSRTTELLSNAGNGSIVRFLLVKVISSAASLLVWSWAFVIVGSSVTVSP